MFLSSCFLNSRSFFANHSGRKTQVVVAISFVVPVVVVVFFLFVRFFIMVLLTKYMNTMAINLKLTKTKHFDRNLVRSTFGPRNKTKN